MSEVLTNPFQDSEELVKIKDDLRQCIGSENFYRVGMSKVIHTEGILQFAEMAKCWWLISDLAIVSTSKFSKIPFQVWNLRVKDAIGLLTMKEDTNSPILYEQKYEYTDFPEGDFKMYLCDGTLMLPSEY